jgi:growth factor-related protein
MNFDVPLSSRKICWSNAFRYSGPQNVTQSGLECQMWQESVPHIPRHRPIDATVNDHNYCRNPDGDASGPWCYTMDPTVSFGYLNVPEI